MGISALLPFLREAGFAPPEDIRACLDTILEHEHSRLFARDPTEFAKAFQRFDDQIEEDAGSFPVRPFRYGTLRSTRLCFHRSQGELRQTFELLIGLALRRGYVFLGDALKPHKTPPPQPAGIPIAHTPTEEIKPPRFLLGISTPPPGASNLRVAFRFLRQNDYPKPLSFVFWWEEDGRLHWSDTEPGRPSVLTPYALSPSNDDLPSAMQILAYENHPNAMRAYRLIELANDLRWLASPTFDRVARRAKDLAPTDAKRAHEVLLVRASEFATVATEWMAFTDRELRSSTSALRGVDKLNAERAQAAATWRQAALKRYQELSAIAPKATLASVAQIIARELHENGGHNMSERAVYQFLWEERRKP